MASPHPCSGPERQSVPAPRHHHPDGGASELFVVISVRVSLDLSQRPGSCIDGLEFRQLPGGGNPKLAESARLRQYAGLHRTDTFVISGHCRVQSPAHALHVAHERDQAVVEVFSKFAYSLRLVGDLSLLPTQGDTLEQRAQCGVGDDDDVTLQAAVE